MSKDSLQPKKPWSMGIVQGYPLSILHDVNILFIRKSWYLHPISYRLTPTRIRTNKYDGVLFKEGARIAHGSGT